MGGGALMFHRAVVTNNLDPMGLGRVRLRIPQLLGPVESGWSIPLIDGDVPSPGDEVLVTLEGNQIDRVLYLPLLTSPVEHDHPHDHPQYEHDHPYSGLGHDHSADDIPSGTFPVSRGGTGRSTLTSDSFVRGNGTGQVALSSVTEVVSALGFSSGSNSNGQWWKLPGGMIIQVQNTGLINDTDVWVYPIPCDFPPTVLAVPRTTNPANRVIGVIGPTESQVAISIRRASDGAAATSSVALLAIGFAT